MCAASALGALHNFYIWHDGNWGPRAQGAAAPCSPLAPPMRNAPFFFNQMSTQSSEAWLSYWWLSEFCRQFFTKPFCPSYFLELGGPHTASSLGRTSVSHRSSQDKLYFSLVFRYVVPFSKPERLTEPMEANVRTF